jgi:Chromosome segregation ATPases
MSENPDSQPDEQTDQVSDTLGELSTRVETIRERLGAPDKAAPEPEPGSASSQTETSKQTSESTPTAADTETTGATEPPSEQDDPADVDYADVFTDPVKSASEETTGPDHTPSGTQPGAADDSSQSEMRDLSHQRDEGTVEAGSDAPNQAENTPSSGPADPTGGDRTDDPVDGLSTAPTDTTGTEAEAGAGKSGSSAPPGSGSPVGGGGPTDDHNQTGADIAVDDIYTLLSTIERFIDTIRVFKHQLETVESRIDSQGDDIELLEQTSLDVTGQLTELIEVMDIQDDQLAAVEDDLEEYGEVFEQYNDELDSLRDEMSENRLDISSVRDDNLGLREEFADLRNDLLDLDQQVEQIRTDIVSVEETTASLADEDSQLESEIETLQQTHEELADKLSTVESNMTALENQTVEVDGQDLLLRAAVRKLDREQVSDRQVRSVAAEEAQAETEEISQQLADLQSVLEKIVTQETTRIDLVGEIESLRRDVTALKQNQDQSQGNPTSSPQEQTATSDTDESELRRNIRELERENRAIKELIEGLEQQN